MIIKSLNQLQLISNNIAEKISKKDCIFLNGEIGVGKTTLTRMIVNYLQKREGVKQTEVLSPTFNLLYEYQISNFKIMHYDLYRIKKVEELDHLGILSDRLDTIKIIEWPDLIKTPLKNKLEIYLDYGQNENERNIEFVGFEKWANLEDEV